MELLKDSYHLIMAVLTVPSNNSLSFNKHMSYLELQKSRGYGLYHMILSMIIVLFTISCLLTLLVGELWK